MRSFFFALLLLPAQAFASSNFVEAGARNHLITAYDQEHMAFRESNPGVRVDVVEVDPDRNAGTPITVIVRTLEMDCRGRATEVHRATWRGEHENPRPRSINVELSAPRPYIGAHLPALEAILCHGGTPGPSLGFSPLGLSPPSP